MTGRARLTDCLPAPGRGGGEGCLVDHDTVVPCGVIPLGPVCDELTNAILEHMLTVQVPRTVHKRIYDRSEHDDAIGTIMLAMVEALPGILNTATGDGCVCVTAVKWLSHRAKHRTFTYLEGMLNRGWQTPSPGASDGSWDDEFCDVDTYCFEHVTGADLQIAVSMLRADQRATFHAAVGCYDPVRATVDLDQFAASQDDITRGSANRKLRRLCEAIDRNLASIAQETVRRRRAA